MARPTLGSHGEPRDDGAEGHGVRSVQRALDILSLLTEARPLRPPSVRPLP